MQTMIRCLAVLFLFAPATGLAQQNSDMLEILQQLTRLENEVRQLRGQLEQLGHNSDRLKSQQQDIYVDLDRRLRLLETGLSGVPASPGAATGTIVLDPSAAPAPAGAPNAPAAAVSSTVTSAASSGAAHPAASAVAAPIDSAKEQAAFKAAFNLLKLGKYDEAISAYTQFLKDFPGSQYAARAQYWLGEANYVTGKFPAAIEAFAKVISQYPDAKKLPDALRKIGFIHYEMKDMEKARQVLTEVTQKYPGTTAAGLAQNRLQRMKLEGGR